MQYLQPSFTMPTAQPSAEYCCDACVFGSGEHADWCSVAPPQADYACILSWAHQVNS